jgi:hypothetical protein
LDALLAEDEPASEHLEGEDSGLIIGEFTDDEREMRM